MTGFFKIFYENKGHLRVNLLLTFAFILCGYGFLYLNTEMSKLSGPSFWFYSSIILVVIAGILEKPWSNGSSMGSKSGAVANRVMVISALSSLFMCGSLLPIASMGLISFEHAIFAVLMMNVPWGLLLWLLFLSVLIFVDFVRRIHPITE